MDAPEYSPAVAFSAITNSFTQGIRRLQNAQLAYASSALALYLTLEANKDGADDNVPDIEALSILNSVPRESADAFRYVSDLSHLTYATTLLDTFIAHTTTFLLLMFPSAIGKDTKVDLPLILLSESRNKIITETARSKSRDIGYRSFKQRIQYIQKAFGLEIRLTEDWNKALDDFSTIRNTMVHNQGAFDLVLEECNHVVANQKACVHHPTPIESRDISDAIAVYANVAAAIAETVFTQVLKSPDNDELMLVRSIASSRSAKK